MDWNGFLLSFELETFPALCPHCDLVWAQWSHRVVPPMEHNLKKCCGGSGIGKYTNEKTGIRTTWSKPPRPCPPSPNQQVKTLADSFYLLLCFIQTKKPQHGGTVAKSQSLWVKRRRRRSYRGAIGFWCLIYTCLQVRWFGWGDRRIRRLNMCFNLLSRWCFRLFLITIVCPCHQPSCLLISFCFCWYGQL